MRAFATTTKSRNEKEGHLLAHSTGSSAIDFSSIVAPFSSLAMHRKASCPCGGRCPECQAKSNDLNVSHPNDPAEIEADLIADKVMRMQAGEVDRVKKGAINRSSQNGPIHLDPLSSTHIPTVHRKCDVCEEKRDDEVTEIVQRKVAVVATAPTPPPENTQPSIRNIISSGGQPLDLQTRNFFEPRLGYDLGRVRIHTGDKAGQSAKAVDAKAYTLGRNIVFGSNEYHPDTETGRFLLAHELAHIVQQGFRSWPVMQRQKKGVGDKPAPDPLASQEKDALATVQSIEALWKPLSKVASNYKLLQQWIDQGNTVLALIKAHTIGSFASIRANDRVLTEAYKLALASDKMTFDFIAWHTVAYANLLSIKSDIENAIDSFKHDDRKFTGREKAEKITQQLKTAIDAVKANSESELGLVRTDIPMTVPSNSTKGKDFSITVTSPTIDEKVRKLFLEHIVQTRDLQISVQAGVAILNQFYRVAFNEGLDQAVEAVEQFYAVRSALSKGKGDSKPNQDKEKKPAPEPIPHPVPVPHPDPDDDSGKKCATEYTDFLLCSSLPSGYSFTSPNAALNEMKRVTGNKSLRLHSPSPTTSGPCPGTGTHYNVRDSSERMGSIVCCPCCTDTPAGPVMSTRCRIVW